MKIDYEKIAEKLKLGKSTLYQWKKTRPELYSFIIEKFHNTETSGLTKNEKELIEAYRELNEKEKELYLYEIKARALRKKLG